VKPDQKSISPRLQALWWLSSVIKDGRSINEILSNKTTTKISPTDLPFAKQILFGSLRYYHQIKAILDQLLEKPLKQKDLDVYAILLMGVYQFRYLSVPDHAALSESVELTRKIKKPWASKLVNGVLRNYQRQVGEIETKLKNARTFRYSHPNWIINQLESDWGDIYPQILEQNNRQAPMTIRVNSRLITREEYSQQLESVDLESDPHDLAKDALVLKTACDVAKLPGFEQGLVSVQDAAAQLVVELLDLENSKTSLKVLDGCAAPGGKTAHILQRKFEVSLTSVELSARRLEKIEQTLKRLKLLENNKVIVKCADFLNTEDWWDGVLFDRILIDVPCSASGVIRRNPDIKIHRKKQDIQPLVELQSQILSSAWKLLKPGGKLVYATCSIFKQENEDQINGFLNQTNATPYGLNPTIADKLTKHSKIGHQILPGEAQMDGFYLCGLEKPA